MFNSRQNGIRERVRWAFVRIFYHCSELEVAEFLQHSQVRLPWRDRAGSLTCLCAVPRVARRRAPATRPGNGTAPLSHIEPVSPAFPPFKDAIARPARLNRVSIADRFAP